MLLPLRLFLGITFIYAGLQKLTDPQFFQASAPGYIGKQITAFATGSPLHDFLLHVAVPHASFFGGLVAYGEIAIGIGTMLGLLLRPAAFFGLLISLLFFLSATWRVRPYFYGADIVFVFCWLTLLIAGPENTGFPALDTLWIRRLLTPQQQSHFSVLISFFLGVSTAEVVEPSVSMQTPTGYPKTQMPNKQISGSKRPAQQQSRYAMAQRAKDSRRNFLLGALTGGVSMLGLAWLLNTLHIFPQANSTSDASVTSPTAADTVTAGGTATPAVTGTPIAQVSAVQNNSAVNFTLAANGDPGILVRLNDGKFAAYDATCTHAGCPVDYDPSSQLLVCPCHGAAFDPAKAAAVVQGPAPTPLSSVPIHIDNKTGTITVN